MSWSIDSPLIAHISDFLNLICSTLLFSVRFAEKISSSSKGISLQNTWENFQFFIMTCFFNFIYLFIYFWCLINKVFGYLVVQALKSAYLLCWLLLTPTPFLGCHFPGLSLSWALTFLGSHFLGLSLYWAVTFLSCHFLGLEFCWGVILLRSFF